MATVPLRQPLSRLWDQASRAAPVNFKAVARSVLTRDDAFCAAQCDDYRLFNAGTAFVLSLLATLLWASDYLTDPMGSVWTLGLRLIFPVIGAPYIASVLWRRSPALSSAFWLVGLLLAETVYAIILNRLETRTPLGCSGYLFFLLPSFLMAASMGARVNLLALLVVADWPLVLSSVGIAQNLNWGIYCVTIWPSAGLAAWAVCGFTYVQRINFQCQKRLEVAATTDSLTGAANRARFYEAMGHAAQLSQRYGSPFAVILVDIDFFKRVNDTYGHAAGDEAIRYVVSTCFQVIREVDLIGRLGGEEFGILLPETNEQGALTVARRIRDLLHQKPCPSSSGQPFRVTCSFGIAAAKSFEQPDDLLRRADRALYRAKSQGRDRAEIDRATAACGATRRLAFW